jgi:hypothetical protein
LVLYSTQCRDGQVSKDIASASGESALKVSVTFLDYDYYYTAILLDLAHYLKYADALLSGLNTIPVFR